MKMNSFLAASFLGTVSAFAQPVITNAIMPGLGHTLTIHQAQYMNPGPAGANQVWNFSALTPTAAQIFTVDLPSATPYASSFTAATMQMNDGTTYEFWSVNSNDASCEGIVDTAGVQPNNLGAEKLFQFPLQFTNNYNVGSNGQFVWHPYGTNSNMFRYTLSQFEYDGYGTLTTPAGTFSNVARFHIKRYVQSMAMHTGVDFENDEYRWYSNSFHGPLLTIYNDTVTFDQGGVRYTGSKYQTNAGTTVGLTNHTKADVVVIAFPNPAADILSIRTTGGLVTGVQLVDVHGKVLQQKSVSGGAGFVELQVRELANGIYLIKVNTEHGGSLTKKVVVSH